MNAAPTLVYRLLVRALTPLLLLHLVWRSHRDGQRTYLVERLGFGARRSGVDSAPIWIHAASVGEILTVLPLIEKLRQARPGLPILVTTNTPTGAAVLAAQNLTGVAHRYLPIDWPGAMTRFLDAERPRAGWIVETEIWPWLYALAQARGLPLTIINARLSPRTRARTDGVLAETYRRALSMVRVLARSDDDANAYRALGADNELIATIGELKFAQRAALAASLPSALVSRRYVLVASSHDNEEELLVRAWLARDADTLMVIAPRHPERAERILAALRSVSAQLHCRRRSLGENPADGDRLYLADTLGELDNWYAHAAAVFVGGSLAERGGHNMLEPARRACPIVVGPSTHNFTEAMQTLRAQNAISEVADADEAADFLARAAARDRVLVAQGQRAREAALAVGGMADRYLERLLPALSCQ